MMLLKRFNTNLVRAVLVFALVALAPWLPQQALALSSGGSTPNNATPIPSEQGMVGLMLEKSPEGFMRVKDILEAGPAYRGGLRLGDVIDRIDGTFAAVLSTREAVALVKGPLGSTVVITVEGKGDMRIQRALSPAAVTTGWHQQKIGRLQRQLQAFEARLLKAHQAIAPEFPWVESAWTKHAANAKGPLSNLIAKNGRSADVQSLAIAIDRRDFQAVAAALPLESHFETMVMTPGLQTLPHTFHHLKLSAVILASKRFVEQRDYKQAAQALSRLMVGGDYAYSSANGEFDRYDQLIRKLDQAYQQLAWLDEQVREHRQALADEPNGGGTL